MAPQTKSQSIMKRQGSPRSYYGNVGFGDVTVYVFQSILGDNPSCSDGCPIALGPKLESQTTLSVSQQEKLKRERPFRQRRVTRLNAAARDTYLLNTGYTLTEIDATAAAVQLAQKQRLETVKSTKWDRFRRVVDGTFKAPRKMAGMAA